MIYFAAKNIFSCFKILLFRHLLRPVIDTLKAPYFSVSLLYSIHLHIAQSTRTLHNQYEDCTPYQNVPLFSVAPCPVALRNERNALPQNLRRGYQFYLHTLSNNADRQDWYIFSFPCFMLTLDLDHFTKGVGTSF